FHGVSRRVGRAWIRIHHAAGVLLIRAAGYDDVPRFFRWLCRFGTIEYACDLIVASAQGSLETGRELPLIVDRRVLAAGAALATLRERFGFCRPRLPCRNWARSNDLRSRSCGLRKRKLHAGTQTRRWESHDETDREIC